MSLFQTQNEPEVFFDEDSHIYKNKYDERMVSVSQLLGYYKNEFDPDGSLLIKCAAKEGVTPAVLKQRWEDKKNAACVRGTAFHGQMELFIKSGQKVVPPGDDADIIKKFKNRYFLQGKVISEQIVYSLDYGLAGTVDLIQFFPKTNSVIVSDFKTNEKIKTFSFKKFMKYPLQHIPDANFYHYELQISLYAYLLDMKNFWVEDSGALFWIDPEKREPVRMPVEYRRADVKLLLSHYLKNRDTILEYVTSKDSKKSDLSVKK